MPIPTTQALRLGLLAGQALERSDNPVIVRRNVQPLRVGLSKSSVDSLIIKRLLCVLSARLKCLPLHTQGRGALLVNYSPIKSIPKMIKFVIRAKKNPLNRTQIKFYPQMAPGVPVMLRSIVGRIEKRSGVSSASVKAVLDALQYEILQTLADGNSVRLGDLGSFRLTMHGEGASTAKQAKEKGADLIKRVSVRFTKSSAMRMALDKRNLTFGAQEDIRNAK